MHTVSPVTGGPLYHFFGYYGIQPWSVEGQLLCLEVGFQERPPAPDDVAIIGLVDPQDSRFTPIAQTTSWNFQQGCMMHWMPGPRPRVIHNVRKGKGFGSMLLDLTTGESRELPIPISALSHDGGHALCLNFARLHTHRPGYGYAGGVDPHASEVHPGEDGIHVLDVESGESWLAVSMEQVYRSYPGRRRIDGIGDLHLWFNHTLFNTDDSRYVFLSRFSLENLRRTAMFTCDLEGDLRLLVEYGLVSHFDWMDRNRILAWANVDSKGDAYYLIDDRGGSYEKVAEGVLTEDGHCSFSPDRRWILTDTYPREQMREMMIYSMETGELLSLGKFHSLPSLTGEIRCDLHPRWSREGDRICFDSTHEGTRQLYVMDLGEI